MNKNFKLKKDCIGFNVLNMDNVRDSLTKKFGNAFLNAERWAKGGKSSARRAKATIKKMVEEAYEVIFFEFFIPYEGPIYSVGKEETKSFVSNIMMKENADSFAVCKNGEMVWSYYPYLGEKGGL